MYISEFYIEGLWGSKALKWKNIRQDLNILVGINGAGKTTLLDAIYNYYCTKAKPKLYTKASGNEIDIPVIQVSSFDVPSDAKKKEQQSFAQPSAFRGTPESRSDVILQLPNDTYQLSFRDETYQCAY